MPENTGTAWQEVTLSVIALVISVVRGSCVSWETSAGVAGRAFNSGRFEFEFRLCQLITGYDLRQVASLL